MKKLFTLLAALVLALACASALADEPAPKLADFTVKTVNGPDFSLYEALQDHDLVLINLWATWCPPCRLEFPFLQEAWKKNADRVAVIALSVEPGDTDLKLSGYARAMELTFPIGNVGNTGLGYFASEAIPTTVFVNKDAEVVAVDVGAKLSVEEFEDAFNAYLPAAPEA